MASSDTAAASGPGRPRAGSPGTSDRAARIRADIIAGTTTAVMLIPQAMAYALLAGLPPIAGLYAALIPPALYAIFGTSRHLAVGPVAMDSLLVAATVGAITVSGPDAYWVIASALAVLVGLVQLALGLSRMGSLVNLISRPVIAGFTSGASILIALSQAGPLLGLKLARNEPVYRKLITIAQRAAEIHGLTLLIGALAIALLVALKRLAPRVPRALVVVTLGALAVWGLGLHARGVAIVGEVPAGLPTPRLPLIDFGLAVELLSAALVIALLSFLEAISSGLATARQDPDRQAASAIDPNREPSRSASPTSARGCCAATRSRAGSRAPRSTSRPARARGSPASSRRRSSASRCSRSRPRSTTSPSLSSRPSSWSRCSACSTGAPRCSSRASSDVTSRSCWRPSSPRSCSA